MKKRIFTSILLTLYSLFGIYAQSCNTSLLLTSDSLDCFNLQYSISGGPYSSVIWDFGDGSASINNNSGTHTYASTGTYSVEVQINNFDSLGNFICSDTLSQTYAVDCFGGAGSCSPIVILLMDSTCNSLNYSVIGGPYSNVRWYFGDGLVSYGNLSGTHMYSSDGVYNVTVALYNQDSLGMIICGDSVSQMFAINCLNGSCGANLSINADSNNCNVMNYNVSGAPYSNVVWSFGDGTTSFNNTSGTHTYVANGVYTVEVQVQNSDSLGNLLCSDTLVQTYTVNCFGGSGNCAATMDLSLDSACNVLDYSVIGGTYTDVYWYFGDATSSSGFASSVGNLSGTHTYAADGVYEVAVVVYSYDSLGNSCTDSLIQTLTIDCSSSCGASLSVYSDSINCAIAILDLSGGPYSSVLWDLGIGNVFNHPGPLTQYYPSNGSYAIEVVVQNSDSLGNLLCSDTLIDTYVVNCFTGNNICPVSMSLIQDSACNSLNYSVVGGTYSSVRWYFGDGSLSYGNFSGTHTYAMDGVYNVSVAVSNYDSLGNYCYDSITQMFAITCLGGSCGSNLSINADSNNCNVMNYNVSGAPYSNVVWSFGDGTTSFNNTSGTHTYFANGVYTVEVQVHNSDSLGNLLCSDTLVQTYTVNCFGGSGNCAATMDLSLDSACNVLDYSVIGGPYTNIYWYFGDATSSSGFASSIGNLSGTHTYAADGVYEVAVVVYSYDSLGNFCTDSLVQTLTIDCSNSCGASLSVLSVYSDSVNCNVFNGSVSGGPYSNAVWDFGDGNMYYGLTDLTHSYIANGTYTIEVLLTNVDSLGNLLCSDTLTDTYVVNCFGDSLDCNANMTLSLDSTCNILSYSLAGGPYASVRWYFGDGTIPLGYFSNINNLSGTHTYAMDGVYNVSVAVSNYDSLGNYCYDSITQLFNVSCLNGSCNGTMSLNPDSSYCNTMDYYALGGPFSNVWWDFGDGNYSSNNESGTHTYAAVGTYVVEMVVYNYDSLGNYICGDTVSVPYTVNCIVGVDENDLRLETAIYPNPLNSGDDLSVYVSSNHKNEVRIELTSIVGQVISSVHLQINEGENRMNLSTNGLSPGIYLVSIINEKGILKTQRVIIH